MKRPSDEDLILHYYGESEAPAELEAAIEADPETAARWETLVQVLDAVPSEVAVPAREAAYGERVWEAVEQRLGPARRPPRRRRWLTLEAAAPRWAMAAAALVAVLAAAFWAGALWRERTAPPVAEASAADRILLLAVADHLDRAELLLAELCNVPEDGEVDLSVERRWARQLADSGRVYQRAAAASGSSDLVYLLTQLEPVMLELGNGPEELSAADLEGLLLRLDADDVLFKVRVVGSRLASRARQSNPGAGRADV